MNARFALFALVVACTHSKTSGDAASSSAHASCGALGDACGTEGASCSPAPIGTGWSHTLVCQSGHWTEMEIAPLPTEHPPDVDAR